MPKANRVHSTPPTNTSAIKGSQPQLRALTCFKLLPPHHKTFRVRDGNSAPHLNPGEFAVIDATDTELQKGEVYLIQYEGGGRRPRHLVQASIGTIRTRTGGTQTVWWVRDLAGFRQVETMTVPGLIPGVESIPVFAGLSDGPYRAQMLRRKLLGRLGGLFRNDAGRAPSAPRRAGVRGAVMSTKRVPEHFATQIRKVEPIGGDVVRLYFAVERSGAWDDLVTVLMPLACVPSALNFAVVSAREIANEAAAIDATAH